MRFHKIKRTNLMAIIVCILIAAGAIQVFATNGGTTITAASVQAAPGAQIPLEISIDNNLGVLGLTLEVSYPTELTLTDAKAGSAFSGLSLTRPGKYQSPCRFVWDGLADAPDEDGVILTLLFDVSNQAQPGTSLDVSLHIQNGDAIDVDLDPISITTVNGAVKVTGSSTVPVSSVTLNKNAATLNVGDSETLTATIAPTNATDRTVNWKSSDTNVAIVDNNGKVTARAAGNATITVTTEDGGKTDSCTVTVTADPLVQTITANNVTTTYGATNAKITANTNGNGTLSFSVVSGGEVIDINSSTGILTIKKVGTAQVKVTATATTAYNAAEKIVTVTVNKAKITKPTSSTIEFTYNGKEQTYPVAANNAYTVSGDKQKNAGNYTVTVALNDKTNYAWSDNTSDDATFQFEILKAKLTIAAKDKTANVNTTAPTLSSSDYTVTGLVSGDELTKEPTVAYASNPDMTKAGTMTIRVSGAEAGSNYTIEYKEGTLTISDGGSIVSPTQYTLTYDTGGGSEINATKHESGTTVNLTATPTREGYTFTGWYSDAALTIKISSVKMDDSKTVYAGWKQDTTPVNPTPSPTNPFTDVANDAYYYDAVLWAVSHDPQITNGTSATTFSPGATCTRGQVVTFLWRAAGCPEPTGSNNPFADVNADAYYYKAVLWAVEEGITKGTGETTFSPEQACTRGQVVTFLHRFENTPMPGSQANPFTDVKTDAYYYDAVLWAVNHDPQITNGTSATTFNPDATCTRGQIVTFLYRDMK